MLIQPALELAGYFWLPDDPTGRLPGTLRVSETGNCSLEVLGIFGCDPLNLHPLQIFADATNYDRIVGVVDGGYITLEQCSYRSRNGSLGGISKSSFHVGIAVLGVRYDSGEKIRVSRFDLIVEGLDDWLNTSGFRLEFDGSAKNASIHYSQPNEARLRIDDLDVVFRFAWHMPSSRFMTEATISQTAMLSVSIEADWGIDEVFQVAHRITKFLCFAVGKAVSIKSMTLHSNDVTMDIAEGNKRPVPLKVYYASLPKSSGEKIDPKDMLFRFPEIKEVLEPILKAWMNEYERLSPAINLFLSAQSNSHAFVESRFLAMVQAAEALHRRTSSERLMPEDEFDAIVRVLLSACPSDHAEWLASRLNYANELSLRVRLKRLMHPFRQLLGSSSARNSFIKQVCDTRNYLTHYDERLSSDAQSSLDLVVLTMKLECLLQLSLLRLLGVPSAIVESIANRESFKHRLTPPFIDKA